jgi:hypothetical protein
VSTYLGKSDKGYRSFDERPEMPQRRARNGHDGRTATERMVEYLAEQGVLTDDRDIVDVGEATRG